MEGHHNLSAGNEVPANHDKMQFRSQQELWHVCSRGPQTQTREGMVSLPHEDEACGEEMPHLGMANHRQYKGRRQWG